MNISLCSYPWAFDTPGGGERQLHNYEAALARGQHKWPDLKMCRYDQWNPDFASIDALHYFGCMPSSIDFLSHIKMTRGVPIILSPNFWPDPQGWIESSVYESIKTILWLSNMTIVNSFTEEEALVRLMRIDSEKIALVPNAADSVFFEPFSPELFRSTYSISGRFILNVANIEPRKNQLAFLNALKAFPDYTLVTIGGVREKWYLNACIEEGGAQFRLLDPVAPGSELLRSAIAACEFFAMPSLIETPSIASLEAAAAGCKILTTHLGSTTSYFQDTVTYINPYDKLSIQEGVAHVLSTPTNPELKRIIQKNYTWDIAAEALVTAYERTLGYSVKVTGSETLTT